MHLAASMTPLSISESELSTSRATKGAAAMMRGTQAAAGPIALPTIRRVRGMRATMRMTKGSERRMLTIQPNAELKARFSMMPPRSVTLRSTPIGRPKT